MGERFADDQARAFDRYGYPYYSGEWNENWFPGYSDSWAALRGAQGILYEQARIAEDGVQRHSNLLSYQQSVHHQVISSFANLETLRRERARHAGGLQQRSRRGELRARPLRQPQLRDPAHRQPGPLADLLDLLQIQGFEAHRLTRELRVGTAVDQLGRELRNRAARRQHRAAQPPAGGAAARGDVRVRSAHVGVRARQGARGVLKHGRSTIYDTTGWNIS
jgi:hypothetical protein